jgi:hypothetical protein
MKEEQSETFGGRKFAGNFSPLAGMNGLDMQGEGLVDPASKLAFHMKTDRALREEKRQRKEDNVRAILTKPRTTFCSAKTDMMLITPPGTNTNRTKTLAWSFSKNSSTSLWYLRLD